MNILDKIVTHKLEEVAERKKERPLVVLEKSPLFSRQPLSLRKSLLDDTKTGIIAEFKRRSPSKGVINATAGVLEVTGAYAAGGASGISVLTDEHFFGGATADLETARALDIPILRKDFVIEEYQVAEAKAMGADVILLIAACLSPQRVKQLAACATRLGLEVLLELHAEEELEHICDDIMLVGINNRNLKTFKVDIERSLAMARQIPDEKVKIAESGISSVENVRLFKENGFRGFLMGEHFMREPEPGKAFEDFVRQLIG